MSNKTLRLAERLEDDCFTSGIGRREHLDYRIDAAFELRRLHAVEQERDRLREALTKLMHYFPTDTDLREVGWTDRYVGEALDALEAARIALEQNA